MKQLIIFLLFIGLISCKEETTYQMQIIVKNETESKQTIQLFPKADYARNNLYKFSDLGNGDYGDKSFDIEQEDSWSIFITSDLNQQPYNLASKIFDSIYVIPSNEEKTIIKFYPDTAIGYTENLFDDKSTWIYEKKYFNLATNFKQNPVESDDYFFNISTEKYR